MLTVDHLTTLIHRTVSFTVADGQCLAISGPSGCGKSCVLRAVADLDPSGGRVLLDGTDRAALPAPEWRRKVRFVAAETSFWHPTLRPHLGADADALAHGLGLEAGLLDAPVDRLSTGQRQRGALIRAMAGPPRVLLLDEPTAALDDGSVAQVEDLLRRFMARGGSIVLVTHDTGQAARLAQDTLRMAPA